MSEIKSENGQVISPELAQELAAYYITEAQLYRTALSEGVSLDKVLASNNMRAMETLANRNQAHTASHAAPAE